MDNDLISKHERFRCESRYEYMEVERTYVDMITEDRSRAKVYSKGETARVHCKGCNFIKK